MAPNARISEEPSTHTVFHEGERAVQRRAGVERVAAQVGRNILPFVPVELGEFLAEQPFVVVASQDQRGRVWASLLVGGPGFARSLDDRRVLLAGVPAPGDPLRAALQRPGARVGVLAIEFDTRIRIRLNGVAEHRPDGILLTIEEAFGNCPKYIQRRLPTEALATSRPRATRDSETLDDRQTALARRADTFFIASAHPQRGADASHRGGRPGFVEVSDDGRRLTFPDYSGNRMFQTLGNLAVNPYAGLLFLDWVSGTALQLTGTARIVWDEQAVAARPGAERVVEFAVESVHEQQRALAARFSLIEPHRLNPPVNRQRR
jgi:predicted pyridoxine 5'-phosphate oxidase superfamily flavin-nucleotide-binding protein